MEGGLADGGRPGGRALPTAGPDGGKGPGEAWRLHFSAHLGDGEVEEGVAGNGVGQRGGARW